MKVHWSALIAAIKSEPALVLTGLKLAATNPSLITDFIAAEKSGNWASFVETHLAALLPILSALGTTLESNPALLQAILSAFSFSTP